MFAGSVGQPSTSSYGLGKSSGLGYWASWLRADMPDITTNTMIARKIFLFSRSNNILILPWSAKNDSFVFEIGRHFTPGDIQVPPLSRCVMFETEEAKSRPFKKRTASTKARHCGFV
jgi:hypothetical protein